MADSQQGVAIELVKYNTDNGKFEVGEDALDILRQTRTPISVVAVCGRARQGKSFILNQLLQVTGGFHIGSTTRPCTKGLWMWSSPQRHTDKDGNTYHIVLLDTEGIDAYDQTAQYSTQIFSLAVLLSSLFVYNQMGGIDEAALDRLSLVTEMTKHIRVRAGSKSDDKELREFTPSFLWLLRDFYLKLEDEYGRKVTATDYLETALMPVPGQGAAVEAKNAIRYSIKSLFPDRDCATLVRPAYDEQALVNLDQAPPSALRPEFREGVKELVATIFSKATPKRMGNTVLTGPMLAGLTQSYVKAINAGAVPTIATAWQGVAESECRRAADMAEAAYAAAFDENVISEEKALDAEHQRSLEVAEEAFSEYAVGDERIRKAHEAKYLEACTARYSLVRARKLAEAASAVNEMLLRASAMVTSSISMGDMSPDELQNQLAQFLDQYVNMAAGPTKWTKLVEFLKNTYPQIMNGMVQRKEEKARQEVARLTDELAESHRQADTYRDKAEQAAAQAERMSQEIQDLQQYSKSVERRAEQLEAEVSEAQSAQAALEQQHQQLSEELMAARVEGESSGGKVMALEAQLRELQMVSEKKLMSVSQEAEARLHHLKLEVQQERSVLQAKLVEEQRQSAELHTEVTELSSRCRGLEKTLSAARAEGEAAAKRLQSMAAQQAAVTKQLEEAKSSASRVELERSMMERQRDDARALADEYAAQLAEFDAELEVHMTEALQERAKSAAISRKGSRIFSGSGDVEEDAKYAVGTGAKGVTTANPSKTCPDGKLFSMTVTEMTNWLASNGHQAEVRKLTSRTPAPRRQDWEDLIRSVRH